MLHTYEKLVKMILIAASDVNFNGNHGNTHTHWLRFFIRRTALD